YSFINPFVYKLNESSNWVIFSEEYAISYSFLNGYTITSNTRSIIYKYRQDMGATMSSSNERPSMMFS
ncbi:MAG: hypothetical protein WAM88_08310, partial [Nitrososphaeraceae archaeon]